MKDFWPVGLQLDGVLLKELALLVAKLLTAAHSRDAGSLAGNEKNHPREQESPPGKMVVEPSGQGDQFKYVVLEIWDFHVPREHILIA